MREGVVGGKREVSQKAREQESKKASAMTYTFEAVGRKKSVRAREGVQDGERERERAREREREREGTWHTG